MIIEEIEFCEVDKVVAGSIADIDVDFESARRDDVKRYMEERYGIHYVASIGNVNTFKLKKALKSLGSAAGVSPKQSTYINAIIDCAGDDFTDFMREAAGKKLLKDFINEFPGVVADAQVILNSPSNFGVHASAVIVVPKKDHAGNPITIYEWLPVRKTDGNLVTEWEYTMTEACGFLKEDILGVTQLDKFRQILNLIKINHGREINYYDIPLDAKGVYTLFGQGLTEDVFQFGSDGLKAFCRDAKPTTIEELIAINALYRPGPMHMNAHKDFVAIKQGRKEPKYGYKLQEVTQNTFGLYIYQEQIMKGCVALGGMTLLEADDVRKVLIKKKGDEFEHYREKFVKGAVGNGCPESEAREIWATFEAFAGYGFVKAHATAYAITGYMCQWFKVHYPLEFWLATLEFSDEKEIPARVSEINKGLTGIRLAPPEINKSRLGFFADQTNDTIYCALGKIKGVGNVAVQMIMEQRDRDGEFFSLEEFLFRVPKAKVNRRVVLNLILAGAFDELYLVRSAEQRIRIVREYFTLLKEPVPAPLQAAIDANNTQWWEMQQRLLVGVGEVSYQDLLTLYPFPAGKPKYRTAGEVQQMGPSGAYNQIAVGGQLLAVQERMSKKGPFGQLTLQCNDDLVLVTLWNDQYEQHKAALSAALNATVFISGEVLKDDYKKCNVLHSRNFTEVQVINF